MNYTYADIAKMIDHSLLNPTLTEADLEAGCQLALQYEVASVCVMPYFLRRCADFLKGSTVKASTTIGFPHGGHTTAAKLCEAELALHDGGNELDMVINISKALSGDWNYVAKEINELTQLTHKKGQTIKVIFENCFLNDQQKIKLCKLCGEIGVDWVKTSTGYGSGGATLDDVRLMRQHSPESVQIKAAGGVRTVAALLEMRQAGVTRIGASRTAAILDELQG